MAGLLAIGRAASFDRMRCRYPHLATDRHVAPSPAAACWATLPHRFRRCAFVARLRRPVALLLALLCLPAFAQAPPDGDPRPPPPGYPPPPGSRPPPFPPPPPPPQVIVVQVPAPAPAATTIAAAPAPSPVIPIQQTAADQPEETASDAAAPTDAEVSVPIAAPKSSTPDATPPADVAPPPSAQTVPSPVADAAAAEPGTRGNAALWAIGFLVALAAWWLAHARGRRLQAEKQTLAQQQRRLRSEHVQLRVESEQLRQLAVNDPLTGTLNRLAFNGALRERLEYLSHFARPLDLIVFDLDHFKAINDRDGHLVGDAALRLVAGIVREHLDSDDLFGRFGGDEFLIACADQGAEAVACIAEAIRAGVERQAPQHTPPLTGLSLSMGIAQANRDAGYDADDLFARADAALYRAKREGRNRVVVATADMRIPEDALAAHRHL
jgi:diguanylate cyclase (GGDEF)-like protein